MFETSYLLLVIFNLFLCSVSETTELPIQMWREVCGHGLAPWFCCKTGVWG